MFDRNAFEIYGTGGEIIAVVSSKGEALIKAESVKLPDNCVENSSSSKATRISRNFKNLYFISIFF
jgi:hypothetical protein